MRIFPFWTAAVAVAMTVALPAMAQTPSAKAPGTVVASSQTRSCSELATKRSLTGAARRAYIDRCMKAVSAPPTRERVAHNAVTSPSGSTPEARSNQCAAEADRRGLKDAARQAFQHTCLSGIGPVATVGSPLTPPDHRTVKPDLGVVSNGRQH